MNLELLANVREGSGHEFDNKVKTLRFKNWTWWDQAAHMRGRITGQGDEAQKKLTVLRTEFLQKHAIEPDGKKAGIGEARQLASNHGYLANAGLDNPPMDADILPAGSVVVQLDMELLSPLLTRDDDPFHLFDNSVRRDHIFGLPHLAASSIKGLASDAFQRGFPEAEHDLGAYRRLQQRARRLFGLAADEEHTDSETGRVYWSPLWFDRIQYLVMNPMNKENGTGTQPIQFEAIAPGQKTRLQCFYLNPLGTTNSLPAQAWSDMAALLGALAAWWPVLGLGGKRLAGYGAIRILDTTLQLQGKEAVSFSGEESWMDAARHLAELAERENS